MTEAGQRVLDDWHAGVRSTKVDKRYMVRAIEAEAVAIERARVRTFVETMPYVAAGGESVNRADVLAIVDRAR